MQKGNGIDLDDYPLTMAYGEQMDALRLDVHNGLLLSALWDAAFDAGLISFADDVKSRSPTND